MKLQLHPLADAEAREAAHWYDDRQVGVGDELLDRLDDAYRKIERTPRRFARLESTRVKAEIRRCLLPRFPYLVIYEVREDIVDVLAIAHSSRRPDYWADRRRT